MKKYVLVSILGLAQVVLAARWTDGGGSAGAVFVMTNNAEHNEILSFERGENGALAEHGAFRTGGRGSGGTTDPLGSQGSLTLTQDHSVLLAVNAGSGELSSFAVNGANLRLRDVRPAGGSAPVAVAEWGNLVYVVNFAGNSNVTGFRLDDGYLTPVANSIRYLTSANSGASSVAFSPNGQFLVVTEKLTNNIDVFPVQDDGTLGPVVTTKDSTAGLFAATFTPAGFLYSIYASSAAVSSFTVDPSGALTAISADIPTLGAASCWQAVTPDGRFAYTSNAGSGNISGFSVSDSGVLTPLSGTIIGSNPAGSTNLDVTISGDGKYLYTLNSGKGTVGVFAINADGRLKAVAEVTGLPAGAGVNGIAAL